MAAMMKFGSKILRINRAVIFGRLNAKLLLLFWTSEPLKIGLLQSVSGGCCWPLLGKMLLSAVVTQSHLRVLLPAAILRDNFQ